jgi:hypothetical protein
VPPVDEKKDGPAPPPLPPVAEKKETPAPPPLPPVAEKKDAPPLPPVAEKKDAPPPLPVPEKKDTVTPSPTGHDLPPVAGSGSTDTAGTHDKAPTVEIKGIDGGDGGGQKAVAEPRQAPGTGSLPMKEAEPIVVGVKPTASVPPLSIPSATVRGAQPDVVSYTEENYSAGPGDSFQSISRKMYGTDAYARALYLFNRSHPLADDSLLDSEALRAKQTVYIPPADILNSRYAHEIPDAPAVGKPAVSVGSTSQRISPAAAPRSYRVAAGGEKVYDIARNLLGDGNRWVEIQKLNPGWNWEMPLPPGATLQMPADARLPQ